MLIRLAVALIVLAGVLGFAGYRELTLTKHSGTTPLSVALEELEAGTVPESDYVRIGPHLRASILAIYSYKAGRFDSEIKPDTRVTVTYIPLLSNQHPFLVRLKDVMDANLGQVPEGTDIPLDSFAVLLKTHRYKTIANLPTDWEQADSLEGMVINRVASLGSEEADLLRGGFPKLDLNKVLIVEEGRTPTPYYLAIGMLAGSGVLGIGSVQYIRWLIRRRRNKPA